MLSRLSIRLLALLLCSLSMQNLLAQSEYTGAQRLKANGLKETCISEPVFRGQACVFEANRNASETVVLVHGIAGEAANWFSQINSLREHYHVLTFDLPGFGTSSRDNRLYSPTNYSRFIHHVTQKFAKGKFHLIGHSMGGAISLRYAGMYPDDIKRLILVDAGGVLHKHAFTKTLAYKWINIVQKVTYWTGPEINGYASLVLEAMEEWLPLDLKQAIESPEIRDIVLQSNSLPIAGVALITEDFSDAIKAVRVPTMIVWGEYDLITPLRTGKILQANLEKAYLRVLANAGHSSMADRPLEFNQLMLSHLQMDEAELAKQYWKRPAFETSSRIGRCGRGEQKLFEGSYNKIELDGCRLAKIQNAQVRQLVARGSVVEIEYSELKNDDIAVLTFDSELSITGSKITAGNYAIQSVRSKLDIGGSTLKANKAAVNNLGTSTAVLSVTTLDSQVNKGTAHNYRTLSQDSQL